MTSKSAPRQRRPVVMAVHAHPDDESSQTGGTLARYAARGCRTVLVTCTDGSQGDAAGGFKPGGTEHDPHAVAHYRAAELDQAAAALGIDDVLKLGYPDSGMAGTTTLAGDRIAFSELPVRPLIGAMARAIRLFRPDVILTYPPNGLSEHPDHIRTHDIVVAAHQNIVAAADWGPPEAPGPRLYYIALSRSRLDRAGSAVREAFGDDAWAPPPSAGVDDASITTVIDVSEYWDQKLQALAAHASQADAAALLKMFSVFEAAGSEARTEEYVRAYPPVTSSESGVIERDFFDSAQETCFPRGFVSA
ncbi:MAG: PIG-L family deacetylase [Mycobacterium sp.]